MPSSGTIARKVSADRAITSAGPRHCPEVLSGITALLNKIDEDATEVDAADNTGGAVDGQNRAGARRENSTYNSVMAIRSWRG